MAATATPSTLEIIRRNWLATREDIDRTCQSVGRDPAEVVVVGVSKYVGFDLTQQLVEVGCQHLGENRPQLLWEKQSEFAAAALPPPTWHMIGHLQRNKVRRTLPLISWLHSLDSLRLAQEVSAEAVKAGIETQALIDVNVTRDASKTGVMASDLPALVEAIIALPNITLHGLMAMSTQHADSGLIRAEFARVRELRDELQNRFGSAVKLDQLSMGMSSDYREALAEGATYLRIGSTLWQGVL